MGYQDLHEKPFDKSTIAKLEIFEDYAQAWIPTFVMLGAAEIHIFDFFSGPGYDSNEVAGSPIRIMQKIEEQLGNILAKKTKVVLHFNEFEPNKKKQEKFEALQENCNRKLPQSSYTQM
jgi:three-Cys-motif partner protein